MTDQEEKEKYRKLAGECVKCKSYDFDNAIFGTECYECKRYYADRFEEKGNK